jgi:lysophospholipase L1-like esterase
MKIAKTKNPKVKYIILIIINVLIIVAAGWVIYDRFFNQSDQSSPNAENSNSRTIAFIGDYVTAFGGEQATLESLKTARPDLNFTSINLAQESLNSQQASEMLTDELIKDLSAIKVDTFLINLGATDATQVTSAEIYIENINQIIAKLSPTAAKIILNCPPLIDDGQNTTDGLILVYCQKLAEIKTANVTFGDESAYATFKDPANVLLSSDGIHPNATGYLKLGELWSGVYQKTTPE